VISGVGLLGVLVFQDATAKTYVCSQVWDPAPTPSPDPAGSGRLGLVQPDMGNQHVSTSPLRYTYCPPASGNHYRQPGGPVEPRVYSPDDALGPGGWVHNLEHGALVVLYRCGEGDPGCSQAPQDQLRDYFAAFPASPVCNLPAGSVGPVMARFDDMDWPFAALVWGRVLPLETLDIALINRFFAQEGERTNPEPQCPAPSASPGASVSPAASASPAAASPTGPPSPAASGAPSATTPASPASS